MSRWEFDHFPQEKIQGKNEIFMGMPIINDLKDTFKQILLEGRKEKLEEVVPIPLVLAE
jgi:hypothetical protein